MSAYDVELRVLIVLAGSVAGLVAGTLIHYAFMSDFSIRRTATCNRRIGYGLLLGSIVVFLVAVFLLYVHALPAVVTAFLGMFFAKLIWNTGEACVRAARIQQVLQSLSSGTQELSDYLSQTRSFRDIQDLKESAIRTFGAGSRQVRTIQTTLGERPAKFTPDDTPPEGS
jgi:hypothetical protein